MTNIHHPAPVNQFYRLDRETPTSPWVKAARWNHTHANANGVVINWDGLLCMASEGAVNLDAHTGGAVRTTPAGIHDRQDDRLGGIGVDDVDTAWHRGWGEDLLTPDYYDWNDVMYAVRVQRRHATIGVDYGLVPYDYQVQKGGNFDHAIGIDDFRSTDSRIFRYDSLDTKAVWTPQSAYRAAAEALALRIRGSRGRLFVGLSKVRPLIGSDTVTVVIHPQAGTKGYPTYRYFGVYTVVNRVVTKVETFRTGGFTATATDRDLYLFPGHTKQELVRITGPATNRFVGKYVRTAYVKE